MGSKFLKRADPDELRAIFEKYATIERDGEKFMTAGDFILKYLKIFTSDNYRFKKVQLLAGIADRDRDSLISYDEFMNFEGLLCSSDALYKTAFQLFDINGDGIITFLEFVEVMKRTSSHIELPLNMDSTFIHLHFGKNKTKTLSYLEFTQFLHDFNEEYATEGFKDADAQDTGLITSEDFLRIMSTINNHLLTDEVREHLIDVVELNKTDGFVSYPYFKAFNALLNNMEQVKNVYLHATNGLKMLKVSKAEFLRSAQVLTQMTPLEVKILFQLSNIIYQSDKIVYDDFKAIAPHWYFKEIEGCLPKNKLVSSPVSQSWLNKMQETIYRFTLGAISGAYAAAVFYPIDFVKTHMQIQRSTNNGEIKYRNSLDCAVKLVKANGILSLYRGLAPLLIGTAPEKALKLTVNDIVKDHLSNECGKISVPGEFFAGACAGCSQVIFSNPLEIVKIRLQLTPESGSKPRAISIIKELGLRGLYKGSRACMSRDICFNSLYFGFYGITKREFCDEQGNNSPLSILAAGTVSCIPGSILATPLDVIKTRLQAVAKEGQTIYTGMLDAFTKIYKEEGLRAFFKGAPARVVRSSPQFGVTLFTYELLQRYLYIDFQGTKSAGSEQNVAVIREAVLNPEHIGGYSLALPTLRGIERKFGLTLLL